MSLSVSRLDGVPVGARRIEVVERKGLGHPDTICDVLAEQLSVALAREYRRRFGAILHHNVDKALLFGGSARPRWGGGEVVEPIEIHLCGRAAFGTAEDPVPVSTLALEGSREWLGRHLHALDATRDVRVHCLVREGSGDLTALFGRAREHPLANDTSCGVGYAPLSRLERTVLAVERALQGEDFHRAHPELGEDVKVMGVREGESIALTVACAMVDRHLAGPDAYEAARARVAGLAREAAAAAGAPGAAVVVNAADDPARDRYYLTVSGTSAESGDDGQCGRGNRANGLITPMRPMTMESVAGKNPVTHVGKLYNLAAALLADALVAGVPEVSEAECCLVSRIGCPVERPSAIGVRVRTEADPAHGDLARRIGAVVDEHLARVPVLWSDLLDGRIGLDRWPLTAADPAGAPRGETAERAGERAQMVEQIARTAQRTGDETGRERFAIAVMTAMGRVPRHEFVPREWRSNAYADGPLPIGHGATISQPFMVALMTDLAEPVPGGRVLEVGTGCGYQAAVLAELTGEVYGIDIEPVLVEQARERLARLGYRNVRLRAGDGHAGWPEAAPFDAVVVTAAAPAIPPALVDQLAPGGRLVIPVGPPGGPQELYLVTRDADGSIHRRSLLGVAFVPLRDAR